MKHAAAALALFAGACASSNPQREPIALGPGPAPDAQVAEDAVRAHLARSLKDPESLKQFAMLGAPVCTKWYRGTFGTGGMEAAWSVGFEFNAKNSYGGYAGLKSDRLIMRGSGSAFSPITVPEPRIFFPC
jgi:hypothetical protein